MPILNSRFLVGGHPGAVRSVSPAVPRAVRSGPLQSSVQFHSLHGLQGVHVPAGRVKITSEGEYRVPSPSEASSVGDFYLTDPVRISHAQEWAKHDGHTPFVRFAMETKESPHRPGTLHVVQMGADDAHMEWLDEKDMHCDYDLDAAQGHLALVGEPINFHRPFQILTGNPDNVELSSRQQLVLESISERRSDGYVMQGMSFFEQVALAAFLNRASVSERAMLNLGAFTMVSEAQFRHAADHGDLFIESNKNLNGMPWGVGQWTGDLVDQDQLELPTTERMYAARVWLGGDLHFDAPIFVEDRGGNSYYLGRSVNGDGDNIPIARYAIQPLAQDSRIP